MYKEKFYFLYILKMYNTRILYYFKIHYTYETNKKNKEFKNNI